jgi:hypothetical protein
LFVFTAQPTITADTADFASNLVTITVTGTGFDATTPSNNALVFTKAAGADIQGSTTASTLTTLTYTFTHLAPTNVGLMTAVVTVTGATASSSVDQRTITAGTLL